MIKDSLEEKMKQDKEKEKERDSAVQKLKE